MTQSVTICGSEIIACYHASMLFTIVSMLLTCFWRSLPARSQSMRRQHRPPPRSTLKMITQCDLLEAVYPRSNTSKIDQISRSNQPAASRFSAFQGKQWQLISSNMPACAPQRLTAYLISKVESGVASTEANKLTQCHQSRWFQITTHTRGFEHR